MTLRKTLVLDLKGFWHAGSGRSAGALADALVQKDASGLPVVGGRHIKGLLRHAVAKAEKLGWFASIALPSGPANSLETLLFGSANQQEGRFETLPGLLVVGDANLSAAEAAWLALSEQAEARQYLYSQISSTAINEFGSAIENSLRSIEVTLPMQLYANLQLCITATDTAHREQQQAWLQNTNKWQPLLEASSMIESLGANRSRGLGEVELSWQDAKGEL